MYLLNQGRKAANVHQKDLKDHQKTYNKLNQQLMDLFLIPEDNS